MAETDALDWSDLRLFLAVARGGGLSAGAKQTGHSTPTLSRHIAHLEAALGSALFERLPRGYVLTEAGKLLLDKTIEIEAHIGEISQVVKSGAQRAALQIAADPWMTWFLSRHICELTSSKQALSFVAPDCVPQLGRQRPLIEIRNERPTQNGLVGRKTADVRFAPFALKAAKDTGDWIGCNAGAPYADWVLSHKADAVVLETSDPRTLLDFLLRGVGQTVLPCFVGDDDARLVRTGPVIDALSHEQWLVAQERDRQQPFVRETINWIADLIAASRHDFSSLHAPSS